MRMNVLINKYYARTGLLSYGKHTIVKYYARIGNVGIIPLPNQLNLNPTIVDNFLTNHLHNTDILLDLI